MDTKLKNIRYSVWFKLLALLCAVAGVLLMATGVLRYNNIMVAVQGDYLHSNELSNRMGNTADSIYRAYVQYADEDAIKATRATVVGAVLGTAAGAVEISGAGPRACTRLA